MKVHERAEPVKPAPAPGQFQRVLQQAKSLPSSARPPASPRPPAAPGPCAPSPSAGPARPAPPPPGGARTPLPGLSRLPGAAVASSPVLATSRSALATPENLGQMRQAMHGEAQRLRTTRTEAQTVAQERTEHRVHELISRELARELPLPESAPAPPPRSAPMPAEPSRGAPPTEGLPGPGELRLGASSPAGAPPEPPSAALKVQATLELIEKIEVFVKSQRPALRMSLGGALAATVEVERTGPREVALRIQGRTGPLASEDLARLRDALEARGLRLRALRAE